MVQGPQVCQRIPWTGVGIGRRKQRGDSRSCAVANGTPSSRSGGAEVRAARGRRVVTRRSRWKRALIAGSAGDSVASTMRAGLTRRNLLQSAFAAGGLLGTGAVTPFTPVARAMQPGAASPAGMGVSISRQFARWVVDLRYEDLPAEVVDRAKGLTLQALASALLGSQLPAGRQAIELVTREEGGVPNGTIVMVDGTGATKAGAVFANAELILAGGKWDTFRMLTHPGTCIVPCAFAAAEAEEASGRDYLVGMAAGYEVMLRMAGRLHSDADGARLPRPARSSASSAPPSRAGEDSGPHRGRADERHRSVRQPAGGNLESRGLRRAPRRATPCSRWRWRDRAGRRARRPSRATPVSIMPTPGTIARSHLQLRRRHADQPGRAHRRAGRGVAVPGDALPHLLHGRLQHRPRRRHGAALRGARHPLRGRRPRRGGGELAGDAVPQPRLSRPARGLGEATVGSTRYHTAYGVVQRGLPLLPGEPDPPEVLDLMTRVTIIPSHEMTLFGPRITIFTKDGRSYTKQATGTRVHLGLRRAGAPHRRRRPRRSDLGGAVRGDRRDLSRSGAGRSGPTGWSG